jgi:MOSC domain-containing protein YiiM
VIELPPWTYTGQDAQRTVAHGPDLIDLVATSVPAGGEAHAADRARLGDLRVDAEEVRGRAAAGDGLADAVREVVRLRDEAAAVVREAGVLGPDAEGVVSHLAISDGGVPKRSVDEVEVGWRGVVGDRQAARQHHGRPWQALCLWSTEVIDDFVAQGDPLAPGRAGENITLTGLPWDRVRPGVRLRVGTVLCDVWAYALPCKKNAQWFADRRFDRMHHRHGPVSRVYAQVLEPGTIAVGDAATLLTGA